MKRRTTTAATVLGSEADAHASLIVAVGALALFTWHFSTSRYLAGPILYSDGMGYLAIARYVANGFEVLAPIGPSPQVHPGYGLLLAPLYLMFDAPETVHRATLAVNSLLGAATVFPLYRLGRGALDLAPRLAASLAVVAAAYPGFVLQSNHVFADNLFIPLYALAALLALRYARQRTWQSAALLGTASAALYLTHPRGLAICAVTAAHVCAVAARQPRLWRTAAAGLVTTIGGAVGARLLAGLITGEVYTQVVRPDEASVLGALLSPDQWSLILLRGVGQAWYLLVATAGVALIGLGAAVVADPFVRRVDQPPADTLRFIAWTALASGALSVLFLARDLPRADHLVYGRYNEGVTAVLLMVGFAALVRAARRSRLVLLATSASALVSFTAILDAAIPAEQLSRPLMPLNTLGLLVFHRTEHLHLWGIAWLALLVMTTLAAFALRSMKLAVLGMAVFFVVAAWEVRMRVLEPFSEHWMSLLTLDDVIEVVAPGQDLAYDDATLRIEGANGYPFWLPEHRFTRFDSAAQAPPEDLVISSREWDVAPAGAELIAWEANLDQALWALPGDTLDDMRETCLVGQLPKAELLPPETYASELRFVDGFPGQIEAGESERVQVVVRNRGCGVPWLPAHDGPDGAPAGIVRIGTRWWDGSEIVAVNLDELPQTVLSGMGSEATITLTAIGFDGGTLPRGRYRVEVSLIHEGVTWFDDQGDHSPSFDVLVVDPSGSP